MNNTIRFSLNNGAGHMTINLPAFFPCSAKEIRHLDKACIRSDLWNNDPTQIWTTVYEHITERVRTLEEHRKDPKQVKRLENNLRTIGSLIGAKS